MAALGFGRGRVGSGEEGMYMEERWDGWLDLYLMTHNLTDFFFDTGRCPCFYRKQINTI